MEVQLEPGSAQQSHRSPHRRHIMPALIERQDAIVQALHAELHLRDAELAQVANFGRCHPIRSCLNHQTDIAVRGGFIARLRLGQ